MIHAKRAEFPKSTSEHQSDAKPALVEKGRDLISEVERYLPPFPSKASSLPIHWKFVGNDQVLVMDEHEYGRELSLHEIPTEDGGRLLAEPRNKTQITCCLLYTSPSPRDRTRSRMPSSA